MGHFLLGGIKILLAVQATQATVLGTVRDDKNNQPIAGAVVELIDLHRAAATDADGRYVLRGVPAGPHHVAVRFIGYARRSLHALVPPAGHLEINVALRPEPVHLAIIEVHAPPPPLGGGAGDDGTAFPDRGRSIAAVWNHPLLAEPDVLHALEGSEVVAKPESPSGLHIRGGASDQTAYLLDGIPVFSPYHAAGVFSAWNPDALSWLELSSAAPSPGSPHILSGTVEAVTRTPGGRLRMQGSVSSTQARLTLDGPLGVAAASYLVSVRSTFPGIIAPKDEASYVKGETGDWLAKLEAPALGGHVRLLGYESTNEVNTAAGATTDGGPSQVSRRNEFEWRSRSLGAEWRGIVSDLGVRVLGWSAAGQAGSLWTAEAGRLTLAATRRDEGLLAAVERRSARATTVAGIRVEGSKTSYRIERDSNEGPSWALSARTVVAAAFAQHSRGTSGRTELRLSAEVAAAGRGLHLGPRAHLRWWLSEELTLSGSYARLHQFAQSLRNAESIVGTVFPVDLYMGAAAPGVPVARSDQGVMAADYRPWAGVRLGIQAYASGSDGVLLVAAREGEPFATGGGALAVGSGASRGVSVNADLSAARYAILASYGLQRVRLKYAESGYVPDHGATHLLEGGVIVFPTATSSIRLGLTGTLGRRATTLSGGLEWEACNLLDQGCEFGGSPHYGGEPLGGTALPPYVRVDLGLRKHWHFSVGGRDARVALFGTVTNIFGRRNVLTYARNPSTGQLAPIEMRPLAPLVVGLDWQF
jgi:hypothetical protein